MFQIVEELMDGTNNPLRPVNIETNFHFAAIEPAQVLLRGIVNRDPYLLERGLSGLLGLGSGLTPAGDDFILGVLLAVWLLALPQPTDDLLISLRQLTQDRTHPLSAAYLRAAADGETIYPWHMFFQGVLTEDFNTLCSAVNTILSHGETSGSDALTGFVSMLSQKK
jgi:hypothetical protein